MDRNIFKYHDGAQERFGDPIALHRGLVLALKPHGGDLAEVCSLARSHDDNGIRVRPDAQAYEYQGYLLTAFRQAFGLGDFKPLTGEGVLDEQVWKIVDEFFTWEAKKKASTADLPTSAPPSESLGQSATMSSSAYGLTSQER